jgi:hypothetical protein
MSELFRESFRVYDRQQSQAALAETRQRTSTYNPYNPMDYTEEDIPRLIKEVRAEMDAEKESRKAG